MARILFVDDNEEIREMCRMKFKMILNVDVVIASSGDEAISILKKDSAFDVIVSDYNMRKGSGLEVLKFKLAQSVDVPFYFYTDEVSLEIPYSLNSFIGVFSRNQFEQMCSSIELILQKKPV